VAFVVGVIVWLISLWPGSPSARWGMPVVASGLVLVFPAWYVTVRDVRANYSDASRATWRFPLPLRGWRLKAGISLGVFALASFCWMSFDRTIGGQPKERNGRYFSDDHGVLTEITRSMWRQARAEDSRMLAGHVIAFAGLAALYLTQTDIARGRSTTAPLHSGSPTGV
jgi:hypothetical protein